MSSDKAASLMASLTLGGGGAPVGESPNQEEDLFGDMPIDDPTQQPGAPAPSPFPVPTPPPVQQQPSTNLTGSVYHNPTSGSGMNQQRQAGSHQQPSQQMQNHQISNFPFPQPPLQMAQAPNVTYADPSFANQTDLSQQVLPSSSTSPAPTSVAPNTNTIMSKSLLMNSGLLGMTGGTGGDEKKADSGSGGGGGLFDDIDHEEESAVQAGEAQQQKRQQVEAAAHPRQQQQQQFSSEDRMQGMFLNSGQNSSLQQSQQQQIQQKNNQILTNQGHPNMNQSHAKPQQEPSYIGQQMSQPVQQVMGQQGGQGVQLNMQQQPGQPNKMMDQNDFQQPRPQLQQSNQISSQPGQNYQREMPIGQQNQFMNQSAVHQQQPPRQVDAPGVMYRQHPAEMNNNQMIPQPGQQQQGRPVLTQQLQASASTPNRYFNPTTPGVVTAGMHNATSPQQQPNSPLYGMQQQHQQRAPSRPIQITKPPEVPTYYGKVTVNDPMLLQAPSGFLGMVSSPPHWSYQFTTQIRGQPPSVWMVRRRFRHVVALEDRLRVECPGAILPPRPDKHVSRALEEASTHQSAEFAWQRAAELERYLNALVIHPEAFGTQALKMFLGLQDDMGTAWPEVSGNAFTRMSAMGSSAAANLSTSGGGFFGTAAPASTTPNQSSGVMSGVMGSVATSVGVGELAEAVTEDSAELLALSSSESVRMGAVLQAVPKLEGAVTLLREQGEGAGAVGMELNRLGKEVLSQGDRELSMPLEIFSNGLLRYGRRTKRLGQEIGQATMTSFQLQYKLCRYEKLAWGDRRNALTKRLKERGKADKRAQQLIHHQQQYPPRGGGYGGVGYGGGGVGYGGQPHMNQQFSGGSHMDQMVSNATMSDNLAVEAVRQCDEIGERLKREVNRVSFSRRMDWAKSVKVIASYMKEAASERVAIWESTRDTFLQAFPDYNDASQWTNATPSRPAPQMQHNQMNTSSSFMGQPQPGAMGQNYEQQQPQAYGNMIRGAQNQMSGGYQQH